MSTKTAKSFVDSITGRCSVHIEGAKGSWTVSMTVTYHDKNRSNNFTEGNVRAYLAASPWTRKEGQPHEFSRFNDRESARREHERVLTRMNDGDPVYVETLYGIAPLYAVRDFDWKVPIPSRLKVRARRKNLLSK
jgi:hypothetical protein